VLMEVHEACWILLLELEEGSRHWGLVAVVGEGSSVRTRPAGGVEEESWK
jgi:hypothetical protein